MNLFILDRDPIIAASMNCDKHVCKIILEAAQMMGEAHRCNGGQAECGAITHRNNHGKIHSYQRIIEWFIQNEPTIPDLSMTPFRQAVANDCYAQDPVEAYRVYYMRYKSRFAKWKLGNVPEWYNP